MNFTQIGDLAQSLVMRRQNTLLKGQLNNLTQELASGRKSDVGQSLSGDFALLGEFERVQDTDHAELGEPFVRAHACLHHPPVHHRPIH